jgi:predicted nucleotidyltransferase
MMRYFEITSTPNPENDVRFSTVTLYVPPCEWDQFEALRQTVGQTTIVGKRCLAPSFDSGLSVDVLCSSPSLASKLLGVWTSRQN